MSVLQEFKQFAMRGNVVDMAVGVIIGTAFGKIVTSFLNDILMPPLGLAMGGADFSNKNLVLKSAEGAGQAVTLNYGAFITVIVDFVIVAFAVFLLVKLMNATKKKEAPAAVTTKECPQCLMSIPLAAKKCGHCTGVLA